MDCFEILNVSIDSDIKTIKKSYAKLVKVHNPEDDPEGYQMIRKAYDDALKIAKNKKKDNDKKLEIHEEDIAQNISFDNFNMPKADENKEDNESDYDDFALNCNNGNDEYKKRINLRDLNTIYNDGNQVYKAIVIKSKVDSFIKRLCNVYNDLNLRLNDEKWGEVLQDPVVWDIEGADLVEKSVVQFLLTHQYMPHKIYALFNDYFEFTKNEIKLTKSFGTNVVEEVINRINRPDYLSYDYIKDIPCESLDEYLNLRELAYDSLKCKDLVKAENFIKYACKIYDKDPELLKIKGRLNYLNLNYKEAKALIKTVLSINPQDKEANIILKDLNWLTYINKRTAKFISDHKKVFNKIVNVTKTLFYIMLLLAVCGFIGTNIEGYRDSKSNKNSNIENYKSIDDIKKKTIENVKVHPEDIKYSISDAELILSVKNKTSCNINVDNIKGTNYYIMKDGSCLKLSDDDYVNSQNDIEGKVYLGKIKDRIILFSDYVQHSDEENANITAVGNRLDSKLFSMIKKDNSTYAEEGEMWFPNALFKRSEDEELK